MANLNGWDYALEKTGGNLVECLRERYPTLLGEHTGLQHAVLTIEMAERSIKAIVEGLQNADISSSEG